MRSEEVLLSKLRIFLLPKAFALVARKLRDKFRALISSQVLVLSLFLLIDLLGLFFTVLFYVHFTVISRLTSFWMEHTSHIKWK